MLACILGDQIHIQKKKKHPKTPLKHGDESFKKCVSFGDSFYGKSFEKVPIQFLMSIRAYNTNLVV